MIDRGGVRSVLVPVPDCEQALQIASEFADTGARFIELCGAFGHLGVARMIEATSGSHPDSALHPRRRVPVSVGTRSRFRSFNFYEPGLVFHWAYLFLAPQTDARRDRFILDRGGLRTTLLAAPDIEAAAHAATDLLRGAFGHRGWCG